MKVKELIKILQELDEPEFEVMMDGLDQLSYTPLVGIDTDEEYLVLVGLDKALLESPMKKN